MTAASLAINSASNHMTIQSAILGEVTVNAQDVVSFPAGLLGFPECRSFALIPAGRDGVYWLQSVEHSVLSFLLVDPFPHFDGYAVDLTPQDVSTLRATDAADVAILAIVTLSRPGTDLPTVNLQGPIAISLGSRTGRQIAIDRPDFGVRCPLDLRKLATT